MDADTIAELFTKTRYEDALDEKRWREQLEEHPLLMTKPPDDPSKIPPLVEAMRQLKYSEECNSKSELALQYKLDGNEKYKQRKFTDAIDSYSKGISYLDSDDTEAADLKSVLYSNRAACHVMLKQYQMSVDDCKQALKINPKNIRAKERMKASIHLC